MKSIKEKAEEYGLLNPDIHYDADGNTYDDVDKPSMDFEAGANYVLGEIENIIKSNRILGHPFPSLEMRYNQIINVIEQLKK